MDPVPQPPNRFGSLFDLVPGDLHLLLSPLTKLIPRRGLCRRGWSPLCLFNLDSCAVVLHLTEGDFDKNAMNLERASCGFFHRVLVECACASSCEDLPLPFPKVRLCERHLLPYSLCALFIFQAVIVVRQCLVHSSSPNSFERAASLVATLLLKMQSFLPCCMP